MCNCFLPGTIVSHEGTRQRLMTSAPTPQYINDLLDVIDPAGRSLMDGHYHRLPTVTYQGSMNVHLGGLDFEFTHLPGHTLNGSMIYLRQQKIAFTGDIICSAGLPAFIDGDTFAWIDSVKHIEAMKDIRYIVPGHGKVCDLAFATTFRKWIEDLVAEVQVQIDKGNSRDQAMKEVSYEDHIHIATGESPAYPQYLMDLFMTKSIGVIYDHILARRA
jgi:glyoxylase-like metal-dependent hydrolase (beta-lactamase superfamily II)